MLDERGGRELPGPPFVFDEVLDFIDRHMNADGSTGSAFSIAVPVSEVRGARIRYKRDALG